MVCGAADFYSVFLAYGQLIQPTGDWQSLQKEGVCVPELLLGDLLLLRKIHYVRKKEINVKFKGLYSISKSNKTDAVFQKTQEEKEK